MPTLTFMAGGRSFRLSSADVVDSLAGHHPEQVTTYFVDIAGERWPVKQVLSLALGLERSAFQSQTSRRVLERLGFVVGRDEDTTPTARLRQPRRSPEPRTPERLRPVARPRVDVVLIGCVKSKRESGAAAKDLYVSDYFAKMRDYAERSGRPWYILSAEHGLVSPDQWLEPYDRYLANETPEYRRAWGDRVARQLTTELGDVTGRVLDVHAGEHYLAAVAGGLDGSDAVVLAQLAGLTIGRRLQWYQTQQSTDRLVEALGDGSAARTPEDLLAGGGSTLRSPGLYSWWVDADGADDLGRGLGLRVAPGLIYAGLAGATRTGGARSSNTLWGRLATMHLGGRHDFSTLRLSLGSVLAEGTGTSAIDEGLLTTWMHEHLRIVAVPVADPDVLDDLEDILLRDLDPPLNLAKVPRTELRTRLSRLRSSYARRA